MKRLGEREWAVIEVLWRSAAPVTGRQVAAALGSGSDAGADDGAVSGDGRR